MKEPFNLLSKSNWGVWYSDDLLAECVDRIGVDMMYPFVGRFPDDDSDPERKVCCNQMDKSKSCKQSKSFHNDRRINKEKMHLEEGEESLLN